MAGFFNVPKALNEPIKDYRKNSVEYNALIQQIEAYRNAYIKIPMYIGAEKVFTENVRTIHPPHDHQHILGSYAYGDESHVQKAIETALEAKKKWEIIPWENRLSIFMKAAELAAGPYRYKLNAGTMLCQSKNVYQAEIDAACELIDFFRFNVEYVSQIYKQQPESAPGIWNRLDYRPLEGFTVAITPFNFTAIAANLPCAMAMMGNVVVWKPAENQIYTANIIMELLYEAGLPQGVINLVYCDGETFGNTVFTHQDFAGLHFTGSTKVFKHLWQIIGNNIEHYKTYPKIVGETGGKDFMLADTTVKDEILVANMIRGAFEYQGQKCSAASRAYIPTKNWNSVRELLIKELSTVKIGPTEDTSNFVNAVINEQAFDKLTKFIEDARNSNECEIIFGGTYDKSKGYFITPTVILTSNPKYTTMYEELFGPVLTIYLYDNADETLFNLIDTTSNYALTGAILSQDRYFVQKALEHLKNAAGNLYINDKPTGAIVGQQPFGGARGSGTNDKAGSILNLLRWTSPLTIKETLVPISNYRYPFLEK